MARPPPAEDIFRRMKLSSLLPICSLALLAGCSSSSKGEDLEIPPDMPEICRDIDFVERPDMREICGVRKVRYQAYRNIPQVRYLVSPKEATLVKEKGKLELRLENSKPVELTGPVVKELSFTPEDRNKKVKNTYDYNEIFEEDGTRHRVFKIGIPTEYGHVFDFCFEIPEAKGSERTRSQAMGTELDEITCEEYAEILAKKKK